jgi:peptidoglycan/xylan/chitin deacetylase (PgdA/CDA1 family)
MATTRIVRTLDRNNQRRGGLILVFHEATLEVIARQLDQVGEMYTFVSLDEFVQRLATGRSTIGMAAITFDDGVASTTEAASALAVARGWPMTFYLPTRYIDTREPYWFLELDLLLDRGRGRVLQFNGATFPLNDPVSIGRTSKALRQHFKTLPSLERVNSTLRRIRYLFLGSQERPTDLPVPNPISWERVRELAERAEISFQAHTVNHLAVSRLSESQLVREMEESRRRIEDITGRRVQHFCYPYGSPNEVGTQAPNVARKLFRSATTTTRGRCSKGTDLALLPRVPIDSADSEEIVAFKVGSAR